MSRPGRGFLMSSAGTRWLVDSKVYRQKLAARGVSELVYSMLKPKAVTYFQRTVDRQREAGFDVGVLGCTEIPLVMNDANSPLRRTTRRGCWPSPRCDRGGATAD